MNEQTTYAFIGEKKHAIFGRYDIGDYYICVKDDSLLDTQILLIDKNGELHWEDCHNFQCSETPVLISAIVEYEIDMSGKKMDYVMNRVWYEERSDKSFEEYLLRELTKRVYFPLRVLKIERVGKNGLFGGIGTI